MKSVQKYVAFSFLRGVSYPQATTYFKPKSDLGQK